MALSPQRARTILAAILLAVAAIILHANTSAAQQDSPASTLPAPTLQADPAVGAVNLNWTEVPGAHRYELNFWYEGLTDWQQIGGDNLTATAFDHPDLTIGVTYYYRIRAIDADSQTSAWSQNVFATVHADLAVPVLSAQPATGAVNLSWTAVPDAARYDLYFWWEELDDWQRLGGDNLTATAFDHNDLTIGATYHYLMRPRNAAGQPGPWSQQISVTLPELQSPTPIPSSAPTALTPTPTPSPTTTATPPAPPTPTPTPTETPLVPVSSHSVAVAGLPAPALSAQASEGAVELRWDSVEGAARYELQSGTAPDSWQQLGGDNLTGPPYNHTGLAAGTTYNYRIRAISDAGHAGAWSEQLSVTAANPTPTPTASPPLTPTPTPAPAAAPAQTATPAPARPQLSTTDSPTPIPTSSAFTVPILTATAADGAVQLRWGAVAGAVRYEILSWTSPGGWLWLDSDKLTGTSYNHTGLTAGVEYYYWIRAVNSSGNKTQQSDPVSATVLSSDSSTASPTPTATSESATDQTATPTATSAPAADQTATPTATPTPAADQTATPTPTADQTATPTPTADQTGTPTATPASGTIYDFVQKENISAVKVDSTVTLTWTPLPGAIHYNIYYCLSTGNGNSICTSPLFFRSAYETIAREFKGTTYIHRDLLQAPAGAIYTHYYVVQACLRTGCPILTQDASTGSPTPTPTATVTATPTPAAQSAELAAPVLSLKVLSDGIEVSWTAVPNAVRYILAAYHDSGIGWQEIAGNNLTATSFIHRGYIPGKRHNFSVRAVNAAGEVSPWSNYPGVTAPATAPSGSTLTPTPTLTPTSTPTPSPTPTVSTRVTAPPNWLNVNYYYRKYLDAGGVPVLSSNAVSDEELYQTRTTILAMLSDRPDIHRTMVANSFRVIIYPYRFENGGLITDLPEFRGSGLSTRVAGAAGRTPLGWVAGGPEVAQHCNHVMIHEIAHLVEDALRMQPGGDAFMAKLNSAYQAAMLRGLWQDRYASTNVLEYWAELVRTWFTPSEFDGWLGPGYHKLEDYDPVGAALVKEVFGNPTPLTFCEIRRFNLRGTLNLPTSQTPLADSYIIQFSMRSPNGGKRLLGTSTSVRRSDRTFAFERLPVEKVFLAATGEKPHIVLGIYRYDSTAITACPVAAFLGSDGNLTRSLDQSQWKRIQVTGNHITGLSLTIPSGFDWTPLHQCI